MPEPVQQARALAYDGPEDIMPLKQETTGWQPIATAPTGDAGTRDRPYVLVYASPAHGLDGFMCVARWDYDGGWCVDELRTATHWMPLPEAPQ